MEQHMKKSVAVFLVLIGLVYSCREYEGVTRKRIFDQTLPGTWLYVEYGYSPGAGYFIEKVPTTPRQTISFREDLSLSTNISGLEDYKFYRILEDTVHNGTVVAFYKEDPGNQPQDVSNLSHSYSVTWTDDMLKLGYRWCIEGCHKGFVSTFDSK
jgi:hypothetical protein